MTTVRNLSLLFLVAIAASFGLFALLFHYGVAHAGTTAGDPAVPHDTGSLIDRIIQVSVLAGLGWVAKHVTGWLHHSAAGKKAAKAIDDFQLEQLVADRAISYVEEQAHKLQGAGQKALDSNAKLKQAVDYAKAHGLVDDGLHRVEKIIEARLGASRPKVPAHGLIGAEAS